MAAVLLPCRRRLESLCSHVLRRRRTVVRIRGGGGGGGSYGCGGCMNMSTSSRAARSGVMSTWEKKSPELPSASPQEATAALQDQEVHGIPRLNMWQEAVRILSDAATTTRTASLLSLLSVPPLSTSSWTGGTCAGPLTNVDACESLIAALLYHGHGECAFTVWRIASTAFHFSPSSLLLRKLSAYTLLVDDRVQEALDLVALAEVLPVNVKERIDEVLQVKHFALWATLYAALLTSNETAPPGEISQVEDKVGELLANMQRLAKEGREQPPVGGLQLTLHALLSLKLRWDGRNMLERFIPASCDAGDDPIIDCLIRVADLLTLESAGDEEPQLFSSAALPFLLESLFPVPLACSSGDCTPLLSGLAAYQSLFRDSDRPLSLGIVESVHRPPSCLTVGIALLQRLQVHDLVKPFLHSVALHDLTAMKKPLMRSLLETPVVCESDHVLRRVVGQQLLSAVETALENSKASGTHHLLVLGYMSRVLGPLVGLEARNGKNKAHAWSGFSGGSEILASGVFYVELLGHMVDVAPHADLKAWRRLALHTIRAMNVAMEGGSMESISSTLRLQLHLRWWLPELLTVLDTARVHQLFAILCQQPPLSINLTGEWDLVACAIINAFHEEAPGNVRVIESAQTTPIDSDVVNSPQSGASNDNLSTSGILHGVGHALVRRFVRWEWFLKGLWKLTHDSDHVRCLRNWENLLEVCISTLRRCRSFRRHDIAKDFVDLLLLPAAPFLARAVPSVKNVHGNNLVALLVSLPKSFLALTASPTRIPSWRLLDEVSHWLPVPQAWRSMQELVPPGPHSAAQLVLILQNLMLGLSLGEDRHKALSARKLLRVQSLFFLYEDACRCDSSLRAPQLLLPLARALRQAGLLQCLSTLMRNTISDAQQRFQGPWQSSVSRLVEERMLFLHAHHRVAVARMQHGDNKDVALEVSSAGRNTAIGMVAAFVETYFLALWEHDNLSVVGTMLLKPPSQGADSGWILPPEPPSSSLSSSSSICDEMGVTSLFSSVDLAFLLPLASREAMRVLFLLTLAQRGGISSSLGALRQLPRCRAIPAKVLASVQRLVEQEEHLFAPFRAAAIQVAAGAWQLRDACVTIAESRGTCGAGHLGKSNPEDVVQQVSSVSDLNRCIDNGDWVTALRTIPRVLTDPLHISRKALLACEKAPKGAAWQGAMQIFLNASRTWQYNVWNEPSRRRAAMGLHECGRVMTLLATAHCWREALRVFAALGPREVDGYIFSQASFALRAGGHPELAVDLWAIWRAAVGDAAVPTAQMCGEFLRCGVVGDVAMARAACRMVKEAATTLVAMTAERDGVPPPSSMESTPGVALPVSWEEEETTIVALLRDRWQESWQEALRVALVSGRPRIIREVARNSPRNHHLYKAVVRQASRDHRSLSLMERNAILAHLDVSKALNAATGERDSGHGTPHELLEQLLGAEDD